MYGGNQRAYPMSRSGTHIRKAAALEPKQTPRRRNHTPSRSATNHQRTLKPGHFADTCPLPEQKTLFSVALVISYGYIHLIAYNPSPGHAFIRYHSGMPAYKTDRGPSFRRPCRRIGQETIPHSGRYMQPVVGKRRGVLTGLTEQIGITEN